MQKMILGLFATLTFSQCNTAAAQAYSAAETLEQEKRLKRLETKLDEALKLLLRTQGQVEILTAELTHLRTQLTHGKVASPAAEAPGAMSAATQAPSARLSSGEVPSPFSERVLGIGLGEDERHHEPSQRPEIFIQSRYSTLPHKGATIEDIRSNFRLSRIETRWSGRINPQLGAGLEVQYHPAPDGSPEELVNDAFIEFYLHDHATVRIGQFVKPFGFDIQQSSAARESPERAIFAGYFFPGQRDRGALLMGDLDFAKIPALKNVQYYIGAFNGNRFFIDSNRQLNYLFRVRKHFASVNLAAGVSAQLGHQLLPPGMTGKNAENILGLDLQYARSRLGLRGELVAGNTPSTLLGFQPIFTPFFRPGRHSTGGAVLVTYQLSERDHAYGRYDQFNGDPVTGQNVRAFNLGYFRSIGKSARIGLDYQFKNRLSFNDDAVNSRLQMTWGVLF